MAVIQNDGKRERRRPSLKGGVMLDVVNGQERARAWPKQRGKKLNPVTKEQNEWFRQAQWATKYMPPEMYWQVAQAVQGTPLLPRDILTMMMAGRLAAFTMPDGRTIWSKAVADDVSQALDVLGSSIGSVLVRAADGWRAIGVGLEGQVLGIPPGHDPVPTWIEGGGGGGAARSVWKRAIVASPGQNFIDLILTDFGAEIIVSGKFNANDYPALRYSNNGGASFFAGASDYKDGSADAVSRIQLTGATVGNGRQFMARLSVMGMNRDQRTLVTGTSYGVQPNGGRSSYVVGGYPNQVEIPNVNALRVFSNGGSHMNDVEILYRTFGIDL